MSRRTLDEDVIRACSWCDRVASERLPLTGEPVCGRCFRRNERTYHAL